MKEQYNKILSEIESFTEYFESTTLTSENREKYRAKLKAAEALFSEGVQFGKDYLDIKQGNFSIEEIKSFGKNLKDFGQLLKSNKIKLIEEMKNDQTASQPNKLSSGKPPRPSDLLPSPRPKASTLESYSSLLFAANTVDSSRQLTGNLNKCLNSSNPENKENFTKHFDALGQRINQKITNPQELAESHSKCIVAMLQIYDEKIKSDYYKDPKLREKFFDDILRLTANHFPEKIDLLLIRQDSLTKKTEIFKKLLMHASNGESQPEKFTKMLDRFKRFYQSNKEYSLQALSQDFGEKNFKDGKSLMHYVLQSGDIETVKWFNEQIKVLQKTNFDFSKEIHDVLSYSDNKNRGNRIKALNELVKGMYQKQDTIKGKVAEKSRLGAILNRTPKGKKPILDIVSMQSADLREQIKDVRAGKEEGKIESLKADLKDYEDFSRTLDKAGARSSFKAHFDGTNIQHYKNVAKAKANKESNKETKAPDSRFAKAKAEVKFAGKVIGRGIKYLSKSTKAGLYLNAAIGKLGKSLKSKTDIEKI